MNKTRITRLIAELKRSKTFNMRDWFVGSTDLENECGTPQCIAGHTIALWHKERVRGDSYSLQAAKMLQLNADWARRTLFVPHLTGKQLYEITADEAIRALKRLRAAGERYTELTVRDLWS